MESYQIAIQTIKVELSNNSMTLNDLEIEFLIPIIECIHGNVNKNILC